MTVTCRVTTSVPASIGAAIAMPHAGAAPEDGRRPAAALDDRDDRAELAVGGRRQHAGLGLGVGDGELAQRGQQRRRVLDREARPRSSSARRPRPRWRRRGSGRPRRTGTLTVTVYDAEYSRSVWSNHRLSPVVRRSSSRAPASRRALTRVAARSSTSRIAEWARGRRDCTPSDNDGPIGFVDTLADPVTVTVRTSSALMARECSTSGRPLVAVVGAR